MRPVKCCSGTMSDDGRAGASATGGVRNCRRLFFTPTSFATEGNNAMVCGEILRSLTLPAQSSVSLPLRNAM
jgi:hypothetical protein